MAPAQVSLDGVVPESVQVPQVQEDEQVCVPGQLPTEQDWVDPGEQTPAPTQVSHWHVLRQVCVPQ
jgi:hypothetical protein